MKTLAKYHVCNHCVTAAEKHLKIYLFGPGTWTFEKRVPGDFTTQPSSSRLQVWCESR